VTLATTLNGAAALPVAPAPARSPLSSVAGGRDDGTWRDGTTSWVAEATLTAPRNETLKNTLTWK
jgi:hypothetical protein